MNAVNFTSEINSVGNFKNRTFKDSASFSFPGVSAIFFDVVWDFFYYIVWVPGEFFEQLAGKFISWIADNGLPKDWSFPWGIIDKFLQALGWLMQQPWFRVIGMLIIPLYFIWPFITMILWGGVGVKDAFTTIYNWF
jgi:hypothetical protein